MAHLVDRTFAVETSEEDRHRFEEEEEEEEDDRVGSTFFNAHEGFSFELCDKVEAAHAQLTISRGEAKPVL